MTPPLIAPKSIHAFTYEEYRQYVIKLREDFLANKAERDAAKAGPPKSPVKGVNYRVNDHGTHILTIRDRKPKWLAPREIDELAKFYNVPMNIMWKVVADKGVEIRRTGVQVEL